MAIEIKIGLVRLGALVALGFLFYASWWLDYRYRPGIFRDWWRKRKTGRR